MIPLTKSPTAAGVLPEIHDAGGLTQGSVYVARKVNGSFVSQLPNGKKAVLETPQDARLELLTTNKIGVTVTAAGTFLNSADLAKVVERSNPSLRAYSFWRDTLRKATSGAGVLLLLGALAALVTAAAAALYVLLSNGEPSVGTTADKAETLWEWAREPANQLELTGQPTAQQITATRHELDNRVRDAGWCLQRIEGHAAPSVQIPGIDCSPVVTPIWRTSQAGSLITGGIAVITAILGIVNLQGRFGFQKSPST